MTIPYAVPAPHVQVEDVWKSYEKGRIQVLRGIGLEVGHGELIALCGSSGCGKSTLLHLIAGLDTPDRGTIRLDRLPIQGSRRMLRHLRHNVGFIFQLHNLIPDLSLAENCLVPAAGAGTKRADARARLEELTSHLGLDHRLKNRVQDLSGGERQRTAICRALMNRPTLILADEPTGSLDDKNRAQVFELLLEMVRLEKATLILATHDRDLAAQCDRLIVVKDGRLHTTPEAHLHARH